MQIERISTFLQILSKHAHWLIRLSLAATFIYHGIPKIPPDAFVQRSGLPVVIGWLVGLGEVGAGLAITSGALLDERLTRIGALIIAIITVGAIFLVHLKNGWDVLHGGMEFQALVLATAILFLVKGNDV